MKVWSASSDEEGLSCTVIEFAGLRLMFDCGVARSSFGGSGDTPLAMRTARLLCEPGLAGTIDAVFITSWEAAAGVPFLTEQWGYEGPVYMTEPVYFTARRMLREIAEQEARENYARTRGERPAELSARGETYTAEEVESSFSRFTPVKYGEKIDLLAEASAQCASSGHEIGGAYWAIETVAEKVVYLGDVSLADSGRHPLPFDRELLCGADAVVVGTSFRSSSSASGKTYKQALDDAGAFITRSVQEGRRVLVPCFPLGAMYDLVEFIRARVFGAGGASQYKVLVVSPAARDTLQFAAVMSEWVEPARAARAFVPTELFAHSVLMRTGQLRCVDALAGNVRLGDGGKPFEPLFDRPSVVFCSHPACRFFDAKHLLRLFLGDKSSDICLVEPDYIDAALDAIKAVRGGNDAEWPGNILVEPLDARPAVEELSSVLDEAGTKTVICTGRAQAAQPQLKKARLVCLPRTSPEKASPSFALSPGACATIELEPQFVAAEFTPKLAQSIRLRPASVTPGGSKRMAEFRCSVKAERGKYVLDVAPENNNKVKEEEKEEKGELAAGGLEKKRARIDGHFFGVPRVQKVVLALATKGADRIDPLETGAERTVMRVGRLGALATVVLTNEETTVVSSSEEFREWVSQIIENDCLHSIRF